MREPTGEPLGFPRLAGGAVTTLGTFDGVHLGHHEILRRLKDRGTALGLPTVLVTFRPHPLEVVRPADAPLLLTPGAEQLEVLADCGVDHVVVLPFTPTLAQYDAAPFVKQLLLDRYHTRELVIGYDHGLGRGRQADANSLRALGRRFGFAVDVVAPMVNGNGTPISSTTVRRAIERGDIDTAAAALGRRYSISGRVVRGSQRGRDLGYPTLNIEPCSPRKLLPGDGVYAVRAFTARGAFGAMMNLGGRPTFGELTRGVEVHLFDVDGDWYGVPVSVELVRRLRDTMRFESAEALVAQLARDAEAARLALTQA